MYRYLYESLADAGIWNLSRRRGECAIESSRGRAGFAAVGRDDWVTLKIVDGNDVGAIIKSRSMPGH